MTRWRQALRIGAVVCAAAVAQETHDHRRPAPAAPLFTPDARLEPVQKLLRQSRSAEARTELTRLLAAAPDDAELHYQMARSYLIEFYELRDPARRKTALALAMESLDNALRRDADHVPALKAKAIIHARAEMLRYDPNLAYRLAARVAQLQPGASEYLLGLTDWLSGEVRFNGESEHRVPHDPDLGLDRSLEILTRVLDSAVPYSNEEALGFLHFAKTLAKRGRFAESVEYFGLALTRPPNAPIRGEILRELGASYFRLGHYAEAARTYYQALETKNNRVDQWLLAACLKEWKEAGIQVPPALAFPAAAPVISTAAREGIRFEDMAPELGLNRRDGNGTIAFGDYDGDGRLDVFLAGSGEFLAVYRNEGARFRDVTAEVGLARQPSGYSLNLVDYDNDARLDLYLTLNGWSGPMPNRLFRNTGGKFVDVTAASGAGDAGSGFVSAWADFDADGLLDFAVANGVLKDGSTPRVYRNLGHGKFADVTVAAGIVEPPTYGAIGLAVGDYDRDGDPDLFINGLGDAPNRLYRNEGGLRFRDVTRTAGLAAQPAHNGFVAFFVDADNDTWPDLLVTSLAPWAAVLDGLIQPSAPPHADSTRLFRNRRDGTFEDVTLAAGLAAPMGVMGSGVADLDNDGWIDFYFGTGDPQLSRLEPNRLFRNEGGGRFADVTSLTEFARPGRKGHGVAFAELDGDGDLDMYAQLGGHYPGDHAANAFYRNLAGNRLHWLEVDLIPKSGNRYAVIGAQVVVKAGGLTIYREVKGSEGFGSTSDYRQHFGLGRAASVDSIEVWWPSGRRASYPGGTANRRIELREAER
ncbi:MAG: VCBS repeat-containing protein [Bryobacterales bacterium]|nr:VCBS repeat-containing protein [Bryobacterales bacterium]